MPTHASLSERGLVSVITVSDVALITLFDGLPTSASRTL